MRRSYRFRTRLSKSAKSCNTCYIISNYKTPLGTLSDYKSVRYGCMTCFQNLLNERAANGASVVRSKRVDTYALLLTITVLGCGLCAKYQYRLTPDAVFTTKVPAQRPKDKQFIKRPIHDLKGRPILKFIIN